MKQKNNKMFNDYYKIYKDSKYDVIYTTLLETGESQLQFKQGIVDSSFDWDYAKRNPSLYNFIVVPKSNHEG